MARATKSKAAAKTAGKKTSNAVSESSTERTSNSEAMSAGGDKALGKRVREKKPRPVRDIQKHTDIETRRAYREICQGLLKHAKEGAIPQTKLLIHIGKLEETPSGRKKATTSLSAILMEELRRSKTVEGGEKAEETVETVEEHTGTDGMQGQAECAVEQTAEDAGLE